MTAQEKIALHTGQLFICGYRIEWYHDDNIPDKELSPAECSFIQEAIRAGSVRGAWNMENASLPDGTVLPRSGEWRIIHPSNNPVTQ